MKKFFSLLLAALLTATLASTTSIMAQTNNAATDKDTVVDMPTCLLIRSDDEVVAITLENLRFAMLAANRAALTDLAADNLIYTHSSGKTQNKAEFVEGIAGGDSVFVTLAFTDVRIKVTGDTAIVTHKLVADTNDRGKGPAKVNIGVMLVFQKQGKGVWKLLARQAYKL